MNMVVPRVHSNTKKEDTKRSLHINTRMDRKGEVEVTVNFM